VIASTVPFNGNPTPRTSLLQEERGLKLNLKKIVLSNGSPTFRALLYEGKESRGKN